MSERDFSRRVGQVASRVRPWTEHSTKRFISDVWRGGFAVQMSLSDFKRRLSQAFLDGEVQLSRADLVEAMPPRKVAASQMWVHGGEFHLIRL